MKKLFISLLFVLLGADLVQAQFSVQIDGGYGFALPNQEVGQSLTRTATSTNLKLIYGSYGQGVQTGLRFAYHWNALQGVEIGVNYQQRQFQPFSRIDTVFEQTTDRSSRQVLLSPSLVFGRLDQGLHPFAKVGLLIPVSTRLEEESFVLNDFTRFGGGVDESEQVYDYEIGMTLGATATVGIRYRRGLLSITAEAFLKSLNLVPIRRSTTSLIRNGEDVIDQVPLIILEQEYVDEIDDSLNGFGSNSDPDQPSIGLTFPLPYSTFGLRLGVGVMIGQ